MRVTLNAKQVRTDAATLEGLIGDLPAGHAVAVNGEVVPRTAYRDHVLAEDDAIEVVTAVAGG